MTPKKSTNSKQQDARLYRKAAWILIVGVVFTTVSFYAYQLLFAHNVLVDKPNKILYIPTGSTFEQVKDSLEKGGYLHDRLSFMFLSKLFKYRENVRPGRYELYTNMTNIALISKLKGGRQDPIEVTLVNIRTKEELANRFAKKLELDKNTLLKNWNNTDYCSRFGLNDTTIVTLFLPYTHELYWNISFEKLMETIAKSHKKFWNKERLAKAEEIRLTPTQVYIMASIVESETNKDEERPRIAGVYMNRLNADQRLQADPTLIFATGDFKAKRVNEYHRYYKSQYNTYRRKGLPPGPINIPSTNSIDAVLNYEKHSFYFFCARPDLSGYHLFSRNFDEHLKVAQTYWKSLDKANIH